MNIVLVYPPQRIYEGYGQGREWFPVSIASIAANLERDCICLDLFEYSENEAFDKIKKYLSKDELNLIGFTMMTEQRHVVIDLVEKLKNPFYMDNYEIKTVVGGPHASIMYDQLLEYKFIDYIIRGEGELPFKNLIESLENNIKLPRLLEKERIDNLNNLIHAVEGLKYFKTKLDINEAPIIMSRGCTDHCTFCSTNKTWGGYRNRAAYNILSEIVKFKMRYKIKYFKFHDDSATANEANLMRLCKMLEPQKIEFELTARADQFSPRLITALQKAGCKKIALGLETGSDKLRRDMGKKLDMGKAKENIKWLKASNIHVHVLLILGWPGETDETVEQTCDMLREIQPDSFSKLPGLMIIPGTPIYNKLKRNKWIDDKYWLQNKPCPYYTDNEITPKQLEAWHKKINNCLSLKKILITSVVNTEEKIFVEYLRHLNNQIIDKNVMVNKFFILHNSPKLKKYLSKDEYLEIDNDLNHDLTHTWNINKFQFLAETKNKIVNIALKSDCTHIFWVDSDLILKEKTLETLINHNLPVVSEIFWTKWPGANEIMPNCWDADQYTFHNHPKYLHNPGLYQVGGTGACILVDMEVYKSGVCYDIIPNVTFSQWEDRAFSIRCHVNKIPIHIDTTKPCVHLYTKDIVDNYFRNDIMEVGKNE